MTLLRLAPASFSWRWSTVERLRRREEVPGSLWGGALTIGQLLAWALRRVKNVAKPSVARWQQIAEYLPGIGYTSAKAVVVGRPAHIGRLQEAAPVPMALTERGRRTSGEPAGHSDLQPDREIVERAIEAALGIVPFALPLRLTA